MKAAWLVWESLKTVARAMSTTALAMAVAAIAVWGLQSWRSVLALDFFVGLAANAFSDQG